MTYPSRSSAETRDIMLSQCSALPPSPPSGASINASFTRLTSVGSGICPRPLSCRTIPASTMRCRHFERRLIATAVWCCCAAAAAAAAEDDRNAAPPLLRLDAPPPVVASVSKGEELTFAAALPLPTFSSSGCCCWNDDDTGGDAARLSASLPAASSDSLTERRTMIELKTDVLLFSPCVLSPLDDDIFLRYDSAADAEGASLR